MNTNERAKISDLHKQYGDLLFRMALGHLFYVGMEQMKALDIEEVVKQAASIKDSAFITASAQSDILRCAHALAHLNVWDILAYIQTDIKINGTTVHPGLVAHFSDGVTGKSYCTCILPADTDPFDLDEIGEKINDRISRKNYGSQTPAVIRDELKKHGLRPKHISDIWDVEVLLNLG